MGIKSEDTSPHLNAASSTASTGRPSVAALLKLAERCECEEPSRQLDAEIMFEMFAVPAGGTGYLWPQDNPSWSFAIRFPGKDQAWFDKVRKGHEETLILWRNGDPILMNSMRVKPLTTSLDAAVTLVPGNGEAIWNLFSDWPGDVYWARVEFDRGMWDLPREYRSTCCSAPALALCAAALRARAALLTDGAAPAASQGQAVQNLTEPALPISQGGEINEREEARSTKSGMARGIQRPPSDAG